MPCKPTCGPVLCRANSARGPSCRARLCGCSSGVRRQHGNVAIRGCFVGPRGANMKNDFSRKYLSRTGLTPVRNKYFLEKLLIVWVHRTAPGVVVPAATPAAHSPPVPGCCGASIATGDGSCCLPHAILGEPAAAAAPRRRRPCPPGRLPAPARPARSTAPHTCSHRHFRAGAEWLREAERRWGTVRCGAEGCRTVRESGSTVRVCDGRARSAASTVGADGRRRFRDAKRDGPC